jgi:hypothetical protein
LRDVTDDNPGRRGNYQLIRIKPHHFLDIIKLYGRGIKKFVPDPDYHHHFYSVANEIIGNPGVQIELTIDADDICTPCKYLGEDGICVDSIHHIKGIDSKDAWNKIIDQRIIGFTGSLEKPTYSALEYCEMLYSIKERIFDIWKEETDSAQSDRFNAFCAGAEKYLRLWKRRTSAGKGSSAD